MSPTLGSWELLPFLAPLVPVHAALLPPVSGGNAKIFFLAGSRAGVEGGPACPDCSVVWDYTSGESFYRPLSPILSSGLPYNFFCTGHALLSNGNILFAGGTLQISPYLGLSDSALFNTASLSWEVQPSMAHGRWYPTLTRLGDERVIAISGRDENTKTNRVPEIYDSSTGWTAFSNKTELIVNYASIFLLDNGHLFSAGRGGIPMRIVLPDDFATRIQTTHISGLTEPDAVGYSCVVLLPPAQDQKFMIIGGYNQQLRSTDRVNVIDFKDANPAYKVAPPLLHSRLHHQAVLLPDRTVFVCGGSTLRQSVQDAVFNAEIYNPRLNTWTEVAPNSVPRLYHSVGFLLPDGRVLLAGSTPPGKLTELRLEIYSPPYLFKGARPVIGSAPTNISRGQTVSIVTPQASSIKWVQLMRPSTVTHCLDVEQRIIDVPFTVNLPQNSLQISGESNPNLAPSGWYMLCIVDNNDVPSVASWVHLS